MVFKKNLKWHAIISSQSFFFPFQNALSIETNTIRPKIKLGDRLNSITYGELRFAFLRKGLVATKGLKKKEIKNLSQPKKAPFVEKQNLKTTQVCMIDTNAWVLAQRT